MSANTKPDLSEYASNLIKPIAAFGRNQREGMEKDRRSFHG